MRRRVYLHLRKRDFNFLCKHYKPGMAGTGGEAYFWLDYFSLRQCRNDFQTAKIVALVREIGHMVAAVNNNWDS